MSRVITVSPKPVCLARMRWPRLFDKMEFQKCVRRTVVVALLFAAGSLCVVGASSPDESKDQGDSPPVLDIKPYLLPPIPVDGSYDRGEAGRVLQPAVCEYSPEGGKEGEIRLTATPEKLAAFRCPGEQDVLTPPARGVFVVGADGKCDTSKAFTFPDLSLLGSRELVPADGQHPSYYSYSTAAWSFAVDKQLCYVCTEAGAPGQQNGGRKCTVFVTIPKKEITSKWPGHAARLTTNTVAASCIVNSELTK